MSFDWQNPYPTIRVPVFARNVVSTSHPIATQAGLEIIHRGGNAVDAIVAAAATLTVVEPVSCGLGGDAFALLWDGRELQGLNASGVAPQAWDLAYFAERYGRDDAGRVRRPTRGWDTVTVPGVVAGWAALHERAGRLRFDELFEPAVRAAERGHLIPPVLAHKWARAVPEFIRIPGFAEAFLPHDRAPAIGELFRFPDQAKTLRRIAESRGEDFYRGETARRIAQASADGGAALAASDLDGYRAEWVDPIRQSYGAFDVHELPPNGQGLAALIALGIAQHFDLARDDVDSPRVQHVLIEAMKLAFADAHEYVADPRCLRVDPRTLLDPGYLARRAALVDRQRAGHPTYGTPRMEGTVYLTAADETGVMVSFIQSTYQGFGSGIVVPGTGVSLQNRGVGFSVDPSSANVVAGGKRPFHTIIPGFVSQAGAPVMSFGVMGGAMQPQGHLQTLVRMLAYAQQPQAACDAPRWRINADGSVSTESTWSPATLAELRRMGHVIKPVDDPYMDFGSGQFIWRLGASRFDGYVAASDSRRDGQASGF